MWNSALDSCSFVLVLDQQAPIHLNNGQTENLCLSRITEESSAFGQCAKMGSSYQEYSALGRFTAGKGFIWFLDSLITSQQDFELFHPTGDLLVHLYAKGHSRRGPSFSVQLKKINEMRCGRMFTLCFADETPDSVAQKTLDSSKAYEIFIPAPDHAMREEAFAWHITTRNFFAFVFGKPLVGAHLGKALVDLQRRLQMFRSEEVHNYDDMVSYLEKIGYLNFDHNVDHALAILYFAEHYKYHDLWIDAFAHCVGMNDKLDESSEFEVSLGCNAIRGTTNNSKAHITYHQGPHYESIPGDGSAFIKGVEIAEQLPGRRAFQLQPRSDSWRSRSSGSFPFFPASVLRGEMGLLATTEGLAAPQASL